MLDYDNASPHHDVRFGGVYDATTVVKDYAITLQPGNFLAPIYTPPLPAGAYTVVDTAPNIGQLAALYLQDSWRMGNYRLDYGLRYDYFLISSTQFDEGYAQISPRIKLTRNFGPRTSVYAYFGRYFSRSRSERLARPRRTP